MASSDLYRLPSNLYYIDKAGAATYAANTGTEIVMKQKVNVPSGQALDEWIQRIWIVGSGAQQVTPGVGRGNVGYTRLVPSLSIEEQIQSAGLPSASDTSYAVPSILYKVLKPGAFPLDDHIAFVRFVPSGSVAEIVWTIKLTPSANGNAMFPKSSDVIPFLQKAVVGALAQLAEDLDAAAAAKP